MIRGAACPGIHIQRIRVEAEWVERVSKRIRASRTRRDGEIRSRYVSAASCGPDAPGCTGRQNDVSAVRIDRAAVKVDAVCVTCKKLDVMRTAECDRRRDVYLPGCS